MTFHLSNIETELAAAMHNYNQDESLRTCTQGHVNGVPETFAATPPTLADVE